MEKLIAVGLVGAGLCVLLRSIKPEYAIPACAAAGIVMLMLLTEDGGALHETVRRIGERFGVSEAYGKAVLKMIGISYAAEFGADQCRDAGASSLADKIELGGRIAVLSCALPAVVTLLETGAALIEGVRP